MPWSGRTGWVVLGAIVIAFGCWVTDQWRAYQRDRRFDVARWRAGAPVPGFWAPPVRMKMVPDLLQKHYLIGMTRSDIEELLGQPDAGCGSATCRSPLYLTGYYNSGGWDKDRTILRLGYDYQAKCVGFSSSGPGRLNQRRGKTPWRGNPGTSRWTCCESTVPPAEVR